MAIEDLMATADEELRKRGIDPSKFPTVPLANPPQPSAREVADMRDASGRFPIVDLTQGNSAGPQGAATPQAASPQQPKDSTTGLPVVSLVDHGVRTATQAGAPAPGSDAAKALWATGFHSSAEKSAASPYAGANAQPSALPVVDLTKPAAPAMPATPAATSATPTVDLTGGAAKMQPTEPREPMRSDFPVENLPLWKKILGGTLSALSGIKNPEVAAETARDFFGAPARNAETQFERADADWQQGQKQATVDLTRRNLESEINERDAQTAKLQQGAEDPADKKIDDYVNENQQRVLTFQRNDGTTYDKVGGKVYEKPDKPAADEGGKLAGEIEAQVGKKPTTAQYNGKTYPSVDAAVRAWGQAAEGIKNREARNAAEARGEGFGQSRAINVIRNGQLTAIHPTELQAGDVMAGASAGEHAMAKGAQFEEIHSAIKSAGDAIDKLDKPLTARQVGTLTLSMRHTADPTVFENELKDFLGSEQLTPSQQDLVVWLGQLNERALSLRNVAGMGQGSDSMRAAIQATLPGIASGNRELMKKQLAAFENQTNLLEKGVPKMPNAQGGEKDLGAAPPGKAEGSTGTMPDGTKVVIRGGRIVAQ